MADRKRRHGIRGFQAAGDVRCLDGMAGIAGHCINVVLCRRVDRKPDDCVRKAPTFHANSVRTLLVRGRLDRFAMGKSVDRMVF